MVKVLIGVGVVVGLVVIIILVMMFSSASQEQIQDRNSNIKGSLAIMLANGMVYQSTNGSYENFCSNAYVTGPTAAVTALGGMTTCKVNTAADAWCACATLNESSDEPAGSTFCIDHRGYKRVSQNTGGCEARCQTSGICVD